MVNGFSKEVVEQLGYYVYRLIDPRNGETFYVGKGRGGRVFSHARGGCEYDIESEKISRINKIKNAGLNVLHVIHRHGMDEKTAYEVEAALIDAYTQSTNLSGGHGSNDFGPAHVNEIVERYSAEEADFKHKIVLINVGNSIEEHSAYEAVRYAWRISKKKAEEADFVLAVKNGLVVDAFVAESWLPADIENFPGREPVSGRYGFVGKDAPAEIKEMYVRKKIPDKYRKRGAANPIKYTW